MIDTTFRSEQELGKISASWPISRLVEVWNNLPGVKPVKKFTDRKTAVSRIWKAIQEREATVRAQAPHVAPEAAGTRKKARKAPKRPTARQGARKAAAGRPDSKSAKILVLLERSQGASLKELVAATGWQPHSVRGFLSGQVGKKIGRKVKAAAEDGERRYRVEPSK